jgi:nucleoside-diphosphate-sugar epimerase
VSSVSALHPPSEPVLTRDSPVGMTDEVYASSKAGGEVAARELQAAGGPVVITYPGGIWGPHDPNLGEQTRAVVWMARLPMIPETAGGYLIVDVRDVGAVHTACMVPGLGPRRYTAGGTFFTGVGLAQLFRRVTGRRSVAAPAPRVVLHALGQVGDLVNHRLTFPLPFTAEGMDTLVRSVPTDDGPVRDELGVTWRDPEVTVADTLRWLHRQGHLSARLVGRLASA